MPVSTFSFSNPGSTESTRERLSASMPVPERRAKASAIWVTIKVWRNRWTTLVVVPLRDSDDRNERRFPRRVCQTTGRASRSPKRTEAASVTAHTLKSGPGDTSNGRRLAKRESVALTPAAPAASPSSPPATESMRFSRTKARPSRNEPAPSARRTPYSLACPVARTTRRLARLSAPMSRRKTAPACRRRSTGLMSSTNSE